MKQEIFCMRQGSIIITYEDHDNMISFVRIKKTFIWIKKYGICIVKTTVMFTICEHCSLTLQKTCSSKPEFQVSIDLAKQHNHTNIKEQIKFKHWFINCFQSQQHKPNYPNNTMPMMHCCQINYTKVLRKQKKLDFEVTPSESAPCQATARDHGDGFQSSMVYW